MMSPAELERMLVRVVSEHSAPIVEKAAEIGARKALAAVGLHDEAAAGDVKVLRDIIAGMRTAKRAARIVGCVVGKHGLKIVTGLVVLALASCFGIKLHLDGGP